MLRVVVKIGESCKNYGRLALTSRRGDLKLVTDSITMSIGKPTAAPVQYSL